MPGPETLPLFPLSNVVLFPRVQTPAAHLRAALSADDRARARRQRAGSAWWRCGPSTSTAMAGDPPVFAVGCEGRITDAKRLAGRSLRHRAARHAALPHPARERAPPPGGSTASPRSSCSKTPSIRPRARASSRCATARSSWWRRLRASGRGEQRAHPGAVSRARRRHLRERALECLRAAGPREAGSARGRFDPASATSGLISMLRLPAAERSHAAPPSSDAIH